MESPVFAWLGRAKMAHKIDKDILKKDNKYMIKTIANTLLVVLVVRAA